MICGGFQRCLSLSWAADTRAQVALGQRAKLIPPQLTSGSVTAFGLVDSGGATEYHGGDEDSLARWEGPSARGTIRGPGHQCDIVRATANRIRYRARWARKQQWNA